MNNHLKKISILCLCITGMIQSVKIFGQQTPVDCVNSAMGNISHLLVPTYPTIHLPNSMLRVSPERRDYTADQISGLPVVITSHRGRSAFRICPFTGNADKLQPVISYTWDNEVLKPYYYKVFLDEYNITAEYAVSHQSAIYQINFENYGQSRYLIFNTENGNITVDRNKIYGYQYLDNNTTVYLWAETNIEPISSGIILDNGRGLDLSEKTVSGNNKSLVLSFEPHADNVKVRYGISFISIEQARKNVNREIPKFKLQDVAEKGRAIWNDALGKIEVSGTDINDMTVFYTSLYRCYERPVCISEDGNYFSASDHKVHEDNGTPFFTDDWIWDTYRAAHPLRLLIAPQNESYIINSFLRMAKQTGTMWMPTFPEITGDSRRMNSNHGVATIADAWAKGLHSFDLREAYIACRKAIEEKTLAPWSGAPAGWLDDFYKKHGYIPALRPGEPETVPEVNGSEKRQPVAVTLGTSYDQWCLSQIAGFLKDDGNKKIYAEKALNYRNIFNPATGFFHPKDKNGLFIEPFDYRYSGGQGARDYYGENNAWTYRWDVQHNVGDLISLMGGNENFNKNLDQTFREPLGKSKYIFYAQLPDHTGNVGQFSMANEPSLHIPYLYNYSGKPWEAQKRIRVLLKEWFRNDLMGVPGDEDGGGMSAFVVFSMLGFYPVTPGMPVYNVGSPVFQKASIHLGDGKTLNIVVKNYAPGNKYIQSMKLNGLEWTKPWFKHEDIANGGLLEFTLGEHANKTWGTLPENAPPSADSY